MIQLTLTDHRPDPERGWDPDAPPAQLWEQNRGLWHLDPERVRRLCQTTVAFAHRGVIVLVGTLDRLVEDPAQHRWYVIEGRPLGPGDALHDALVGKRTPYTAHQSIKYLDEGDLVTLALAEESA